MRASKLLCIVIGFVSISTVATAADLPAEYTSQSTGMKFVLIPAGTFQMGSSAADIRNSLQSDSDLREEDLKVERPQHAVGVSQPFYIGVCEVTQSAYESVMGTNPSYFTKTGGGNSEVSGQNTSTFPVEQVTWFDAVAFCNKLGEKDRRPAYYRLTGIERNGASIKAATVTVMGGTGYRLPTEAEWEYACRAGTTTAFHFGDVLNGDKANVNGNDPFGTTAKGKYLGRTTTVGSYAKNAFGLFDMHGNVSEWCEDVYEASIYTKRTKTTTDPLVTNGSQYRVLRGSSWSLKCWTARSAVRLNLAPDYRISLFGFRVVLSSSVVTTP